MNNTLQNRKERYQKLVNAGVSPAFADKFKSLSEEKVDAICKITKLRDLDYFDNLKKITGRYYGQKRS